MQDFNPISQLDLPLSGCFVRVWLNLKDAAEDRTQGPNQRMGARGGWCGETSPHHSSFSPGVGGVHSDEGLMAIGRLVGGWLPRLWETAVFSLVRFEINGMDGGGQTW